MRTHRFGRKLKLPSTIAIKHQIRKLMFEDSVEKAKAGARAEAIRGQLREENTIARAVGPTVSVNSHQALDRAEALFKKKEERLREGQEAMADYEAAGHAMREKTARLRALRLARDAANNQAPILPARKRSAFGE
jgi:hypothetical protein